MNKEELLFDSKEQKEATERVLAVIRVKTISKEIDLLVSELISYASNIDKILERNGIEKRYLEKVSSIENLSLIYLDPDLESADFRVKEVVDDLIKRVNTRISLVKNNDELIKELKDTYEINEDNMKDDIDLARLNLSDFINDFKEQN